ncbi:hypothetical protein L5159_004581 [Vibrio parahaemolyticus]|nr:hypothetical protein [Vibrio parahaemolyticus]
MKKSAEQKSKDCSLLEAIKDSFGFISMILIYISVFVWVVVGIQDSSYEGYGFIVMILVPVVLLLMAILTVKDIAKLMDDGHIDSKACKIRHAIYATLVVLGVAGSLYMKFNLVGGLIVMGLTIVGKIFTKNSSGKVA